MELKMGYNSTKNYSNFSAFKGRTHICSTDLLAYLFIIWPKIYWIISNLYCGKKIPTD